MLVNNLLRKRTVWLVTGLTLAAGIIVLSLILLMRFNSNSSSLVPGSRVVVSLAPVKENTPKHKSPTLQKEIPLPEMAAVHETGSPDQAVPIAPAPAHTSLPVTKETAAPNVVETPTAAITLKPSIKLNNTSPVFNPDTKKQMAVILTGLGLQEELFKKIIEDLDPAITLAFYGSAENTAAQMLEARRRGHELLVMVPMEPYDYPNNDPGPGTLLTGFPAEENLKRLNQILTPLSGYVGVINYLGARFTASAVDYEPIIAEFKRRNLMLLDHYSAPRSLAREIGNKHALPVIRTKKVLETGLSREKMIHHLDNFAYSIEHQEVAVVLIPTYPEAVEALKEWTAHLKDKPVALVPISAIVLVP